MPPAQEPKNKAPVSAAAEELRPVMLLLFGFILKMNWMDK